MLGNNDSIDERRAARAVTETSVGFIRLVTDLDEG
jgi:hypothetical protein